MAESNQPEFEDVALVDAHLDRSPRNVRLDVIRSFWRVLLTRGASLSSSSQLERRPLSSLVPLRGIAAMKLLHRHRTLSIVTSGLLLTEFLFFLLVALSLPIVKSIYIMGVTAHVQPDQPVTSVATRLRFGVWGVCAHR